ncbi:heme-binding protein [Maioricimonas sp. JC845]|uniref:GlcG/HbpS family heme-binding protein n=1 Tax=Maioricimonas sp. JC845 TaxID=3232138 RepID=UPI00345AA59B
MQRGSFLAVITALFLGSSAIAFADDSRPAEPAVIRNHVRLTQAGARQVLDAALAQARKMDLAVNISVVDDGGHLFAFARMDGARPGSIYTSMTKATTAALIRKETGPIPTEDNLNTHLSLAVENAATVSGGKFTTLKGGVPIIVDGQVVGAVGVGGATGEQDREIARAGVAALAKESARE